MRPTAWWLRPCARCSVAARNWLKTDWRALAAVQESRYDLILMDIKMPRMDGVQATQAIRALDGAVSRIPIVALTANADPDDAKHYLSIGMAAVVEKPIKPERLRMAMNAALAQAEAEAAARNDADPRQAHG
ncbi:response regulator [Brevundimonas sp. SORGH_AS_0993]|uniref:response regulator n=1 Tax=Brevundimonas sp. SORGH_AS_0993 TaxID=3041794 RepID=UPI0027D86F83|nr:response regulator [Brevundimonas sp. SORGH_AS_0993]